ncbi:hypothetical protein MHB44_14460 [Lysinibacillus sp. FSL H8-0500]|uniref:hypothetical protein n=1 Tax=Lysinibacillus sp. FSL H8-0500 TaxID=2921393 RepID=UPI0031010CB1
MAKFEEVRYIYNIPSIGIYESTYLIEGIELASIEEVKKELFDQGTLIHFIPNRFEIDEDSPLQNFVGRGDDFYYIVCKEGVYSYEFNEYEFVGEFRKDKIERTKYVSIPNDIFVRKNEDLILVKEGIYEMSHWDVIELDNGEKHEIFEIYVETEEYAPGEFSVMKVKVPNHPGVFLIYECDNLDTDYLVGSENESSVYQL